MDWCNLLTGLFTSAFITWNCYYLHYLFVNYMAITSAIDKFKIWYYFYEKTIDTAFVNDVEHKLVLIKF